MAPIPGVQSFPTISWLDGGVGGVVVLSHGNVGAWAWCATSLTVPITLCTTTFIQLLSPAILTRMSVRVQFRLWWTRVCTARSDATTLFTVVDSFCLQLSPDCYPFVRVFFVLLRRGVSDNKFRAVSILCAALAYFCLLYTSPSPRDRG